METFNKDDHQLVQFYHQFGYVVVDDVMSAEECDLTLGVFERNADKDYSTILNLDRREPFVRRYVMRHPIVVGLVERLIGEADGCQTFFLFKKPGTRYAAQEFCVHQDNSYPQSPAGKYLAVDIALTDQEKNSGGICIWPGTHNLGLLPVAFAATGYREEVGQKAGQPCVLPKGFDAMFSKEDVMLKKGQAIIFDGNLIHASYPNLSSNWRPAVITNYLAKGAFMIPGRTANRQRIPLR